MTNFEPDFIFHLAAQPIVSVSYKEPLETISTNVLGTSVILESLRIWNKKCSVVIITSDKCYENVEWVWGYKETDQLEEKIYIVDQKALQKLFSTLTLNPF